MLASIIIDNYNYGRFLNEAIDSALQQTYPHVEVIVVDDGSTDDSREVIAGYGSRIISVLKENGGQASAFNAGFAANKGEIVLFLDSDDMLLPSAVQRAVESLRASDAVKVHWPMWVVDERGNKTGNVVPGGELPEGDLRQAILEGGPSSCTSSPTSGNAWTRQLLQQILPIPEEIQYYKTCGDEYLYNLAAATGRVARIMDPQGLYRIHGGNIYSSKSFDEKLRLEISGHDQQCIVLSDHFRTIGIQSNTEAWRTNSWWRRLQTAAGELTSIIPAQARFILIDNGTWGMDSNADRRSIPLMECNGENWGPPPDDQTAITELERLRQRGAGYIVFAWPAFWWLDHYTGLHRHLRASYRAVLENDRLVIFDLGEQAPL